MEISEHSTCRTTPIPRTEITCEFVSGFLTVEYNSIPPKVSKFPTQDFMSFPSCSFITQIISQLPQGVHSANPEIHLVLCTCAKPFFERLYQTSFSQEFFFRKQDYQQLLDSLLFKNYITQEDKSQLTEANESLCEDDINDNILQSQDVQKCLQRLTYYYRKLQFDFSSRIKIVVFINQIQEILGESGSILIVDAEHNIITNFFTNYCSSLSCTDNTFGLLQHRKIIDILIEMEKVKQISRYYPGLIGENLWQNLCYFISRSTSLKKLKLECDWDDNMEHKMNGTHLPMLAESIVKSQSLAKIVMTCNSFSVNGMKKFIETISPNKNIQLLDIRGSTTQFDISAPFRVVQ
jgi:hypothetical protein